MQRNGLPSVLVFVLASLAGCHADITEHVVANHDGTITSTYTEAALLLRSVFERRPSMKYLAVLIVSIVLAAGTDAPRALAASSRAASSFVAVTQVETPLGCINTVVVRANAPTGPFMADGGTITFRDNIAPGRSPIDSLYIAPGSDPVASAGQRVRVCLLDIPKAQGGCDPARDPRGREFLVINLEAAQENLAGVYYNGEHGCGGA